MRHQRGARSRQRYLDAVRQVQTKHIKANNGNFCLHCQKQKKIEVQNKTLLAMKTYFVC